MIGIRTGLKSSRVGLAVGLTADPLAPPATSSLAGVTLDATSGKYFPANAAQWTTTLTAASIASGNPSHVYNAQEASGDLLDAIGALPISPVGALSYQQTVPGFTRKGVQFTDGGTGYMLATTPAGFDVSSGLVIQVLSVVTDPAGQRILDCLGNGRYESATIETGKKIGVRSEAVTVSGTTAYSGSLVVVLRLNVTAASIKVFTQTEATAGTYSAQLPTNAERLFMLGDGSAGSTDWPLVYAAVFRGAAAQLTDAQIRTLLQTLGWSVAW